MLIAGVDEAGRGPLAGPVVAAAVILPDNCDLPLVDSKKLTPKKREILFPQIKATAIAWQIAQASVDEIDRLNILQATFLAMTRAVTALRPQPQRVQVDGNQSPTWSYPTETLIKGDTKIKAISAASILAKVARDHIMLNLHAQYPAYQFNQHKGYPTPTHKALVKKLGHTPHHRKTFKVN